MNKEDKELLLKDLSARLPYKVKIEITWWVVDEGTCMNTTLEPDHIDQLLNDDDTEIKPYLRPMSSMTIVERQEYGLVLCGELSINQYDWLNAHHFDFRNLIERGLAIEVTEENNPYKEYDGTEIAPPIDSDVCG